MTKGALIAVVVIAVAAALMLRGRDAGGQPEQPSEPGPGPGTAEVQDTGGSEPGRAEEATRPIAGIVIGPDDAPVSGAVVTLHEVLSPWPGIELRRLEWGYTRDDGRFEFVAPTPLDLLVEVTREGLARERVVVPPGARMLSVRMDHGFEVTGFVQDPRGRLVSEGCEVFLEPGAWGSFSAERTTTDANGQFRFANVRAGLARITARSDFYQPATAPMVTIGSGSRIGLRFDSISLVTLGRVVSAGDNRPVSGAKVLVYPGSWNGSLYEPIVDETDEQGRFKMRGLGASNLRFEVHHPDYSVATRGVSARPGNDQIVLELVERVTVSGQLRGSVVPGAAVRIRTAVGEKGRAVVGPDGEFEFARDLSVGAAELEIEGGALAFQRTSSRFFAATLDEVGRVRFELDVVAPSVVRGRVLDHSTRVVPGVLVSTARTIERDPERIVAVTGDDGVFELRGLEPGSASLQFEHDGLVAFEQSVTVPATGQVVDVGDVTLAELGMLSGRVIRDGEPLAGTTVFAGRPKESRTAVSGPDGRFVVRGLVPGTYRVKARYSTLPLVTAGDAVEVRAGETTTLPDFVFPAGRRVAGRVTEPNGRPISDALVYVAGSLGSGIYTDSRGLFEIDVSEKAYDLQIWAPDFTVHVTEPIPSRGDEMWVSLPIVKRSTIRARVVGLPHRGPVTSGIVRIIGDRSSETWDETTARQRDVGGRVVEMPNGLLSIDWVPVGRSLLTLQCQGFAPFTTEVEVVHRDPLELPTIVLEPGAEVFGRVVDAAGEPIAGADVFLGDETDLVRDGFRAQVKTDTEGRFLVRGVTPESRRIVVWTEGCAATAYDVEIPRDLLRTRENPLEILLWPCSTIEVEVLDIDGNPTDERLVVLLRGGVPIADEFPDIAGMASFQTRGPGLYEVMLFGEESIANVEVGDRPTVVRVTLRSTR